MSGQPFLIWSNSRRKQLGPFRFFFQLRFFFSTHEHFSDPELSSQQVCPLGSSLALGAPRFPSLVSSLPLRGGFHPLPGKLPVPGPLWEDGWDLVTFVINHGISFSSVSFSLFSLPSECQYSFFISTLNQIFSCYSHFWPSTSVIIRWFAFLSFVTVKGSDSNIFCIWLHKREAVDLTFFHDRAISSKSVKVLMFAVTKNETQFSQINVLYPYLGGIL